MVYFLEIFVLIYIVYSCVKIFLHPFYQNLIGILSFLIAAVGSGFTLWGVISAAPHFLHNLFVQGLFCLLITLLAFIMILYLGHKIFSPLIEGKIETNSSFAHWPKWLDKGLNSLLICGYLLLVFLIADLFIQVLSFAPQGSQLLEKSFLARAFLPPSSSPIPEKPMIQDSETSQVPETTQLSTNARAIVTPSAPRESDQNTHLPDLDSGKQKTEAEAIREPRKWVPVLHHGFQQTRDFLTEKLGTKAVVEYVNMVKELSLLSDDEKVWLIQTTPALQTLAGNSSVLAIIEDQQLMSLISQASQGSGKALYQLGEDPLIKRLFEDREIVDAIRQIDLQQLLQRVRNRR